MKNKLLLLVLSITFLASCKDLFEGKKEKGLLDFIKENPDRASFLLSSNDSLMINQSGDLKAGLGNTAHLIIALEFARQISSGTMEADTMASLTDIEVFNLQRKIDPGHYLWLKHLQSNNLINENNTITLEQVVSGMLRFESMAAAEYLGGRLGIENINQNLTELNLKDHDPVYPFPVSSYLLFSTYQGDPRIKLPRLPEKITERDLAELCGAIHQGLKKDTAGYLRATFFNNPPQINMALYSAWQPKATASAYHRILELTRSEKSRLMSENCKYRLQRLMDWSLSGQKPEYTHLGIKKGVTETDITAVIYANSRGDSSKINRTEIVCFLSDLNQEERIKLNGVINGFLINCTEKRNVENIIQQFKKQ